MTATQTRPSAISGLSRICRDNGSDLFSRVWLIDLNNEQWSFATNGYVLCAQRGALPDAIRPESVKVDAPKVTKCALKFLSGFDAENATAVNTRDFLIFLNFLGAAKWPRSCARCNGTGEGDECDCGPRSRDYCELCNGTGIIPCERCKGDGGTYPEDRPVVLKERGEKGRFNANLVAQALAVVNHNSQSCRVKLNADNSISMRGADWFVIAMGMKWENSCSKEYVFTPEKAAS